MEYADSKIDSTGSKLSRLSHEYNTTEIKTDYSNPAYQYAYQFRMARLQQIVEWMVSEQAMVIDTNFGQDTRNLRFVEARNAVAWIEYRDYLVNHAKRKYQYGKILYLREDIPQRKPIASFDTAPAAEA